MGPYCVAALLLTVVLIDCTLINIYDRVVKIHFSGGLDADNRLRHCYESCYTASFDPLS